ncbi:MAG: PQQ-binding-like beta-propeller repeat protein [Spirochaetes bacterium]|nr:PQQ-binding-like beta-propeller repeat protein [Spirochaetota bacterium]
MINKKNIFFRKKSLFFFLLFVVLLSLICYLIAVTPFGNYNLQPDRPVQPVEGRFSYSVPLDPHSPWPKFRANVLQNGRSPVLPVVSDLKPWQFQTGKGIFSSPVVDGEGTVYIGSADHNFYAITRDGRLKWRFATAEVIDSSALLDDRQRLYFGSGDGYVYCLDRKDGRLIWKFAAHTPQEVQEQFKIKTYNVNWFEGNIGMLKDGTLLAPNDNYLVYAIDRDLGQSKKHFTGNEMIWSLPSYNPATNRIFFCSTFIGLKNTFAYASDSGKKLWHKGGLGSVAASSLLTSSDPRGALIVGGFDGILRAFTQQKGKQLWKLATRDHIYGSPGQLSDGTLIQASADGTIYAVNPDDGTVKWAFDTLEPIRSSPAIDARDTIYIGSGEGKLFAINPDGTLRWAYQLIKEERNDLNASPALGKEGIYIAGESGAVFFVPYDYPLTAAGQQDPRSISGPGEALPTEGDFLIFTSKFGTLKIDPPRQIDANQSLAFSLLIRKKGDTLHSAIDQKSLKVTFSSNQQAMIHVSADKKFITVIPQQKWLPGQDGKFSITLQGDYYTQLSRLGLKSWGGKKSGSFQQTFTFNVSQAKGTLLPYQIPEKPGDPASVFEISRLSAPNPTMLPSWNQIGFDSLHYLAGMVEGRGSNAIVWVVPGKLEQATGQTKIEPALKDVFVLNLEYDQGCLTLSNFHEFKLSFVGTWDMPFQFYRLAARVDPVSGQPLGRASINAIANGDEIKLYGNFLKLMGLTDFKTGLMHIYGGLNFSLWNEGLVQAPQNRGNVTIEVGQTSATAFISNSRLKKDAHVWGILLINSATGQPVAADYARQITVQADERGNVTQVKLDYKKNLIQGKVRAYLMIDTYPAYRQETEVKKD